VSKVRAAFVAGAIAAGLGIAQACGVSFPASLYAFRVDSLLGFVSFGFYAEAERLVRADGGPTLAAREEDPYPVFGEAETRFDRARKEAEAQDLDPAAITAIARMRQAQDGDAAFVAGSGVPAAARLYTAGAVDFRRDAFAAAARRFAAILDLPDADSRPRAVWAAYMLGRAEAALGNADRAAASFQRARALAMAGAPDPQGLAVASYGEEARLHYARAKATIDEELFRPDCLYEGVSWDWSPAQREARLAERQPICRAREAGRIAFEAEARADPTMLDAFAASVAEAVALYARQAAAGSASGRSSLREIVEFVWRSDVLTEALARDVLGLRLLVATQFAHPYQLAIDAVRARAHDGAPDRAMVDVLMTAIERAADRRPEGLDRMAAFAYEAGRFDLAARLAAMSQAPLAFWTRAKLATRVGDFDAASEHFAAALDRAESLTPFLRANLIGESAVLETARGRFVAALDRFVSIGGPLPEPYAWDSVEEMPAYWPDIAHLAERVLTIEELAGWVAARDPANVTGELVADLLARRLARAGRYDEAVAHFGIPQEASLAKAMADDLLTFDTVDGPVARAAAGFSAARRMRDWGMEMIGYQTSPDGAIFGGGYEWSELGLRRTDPFIAPEEHARFETTRAVPNLRFHYRYRASELAERAADLLPQRSQAFAATMCWATRWMLETEAEDAQLRARRLYIRYLREGPYVPWGGAFGRDCPEPDFARAANFERERPWRELRGWLRRHKQEIVAAGSLAGAGALYGLFLVVRRRRGAAVA
jgi:cellulose synthase operon protein C